MAGEHGLAFPLVHERLDPVALEPVGQGGVGGAAGAPFGLGREAGRRTLEDEAANDPRVRDREPQRDAGAQRIADDVGRRWPAGERG